MQPRSHIRLDRPRHYVGTTMLQCVRGEAGNGQHAVQISAQATFIEGRACRGSTPKYEFSRTECIRRYTERTLCRNPYIFPIHASAPSDRACKRSTRLAPKKRASQDASTAHRLPFERPLFGAFYKCTKRGADRARVVPYVVVCFSCRLLSRLQRDASKPALHRAHSGAQDIPRTPTCSDRPARKATEIYCSRSHHAPTDIAPTDICAVVRDIGSSRSGRPMCCSVCHFRLAAEVPRREPFRAAS